MRGRLAAITSVLLLLILAATAWIAFNVAFPSAFETNPQTQMAATQLKEVVEEFDADSRLSPFTVDCLRREDKEFLCLVEGTDPDGDEVSIGYDVLCSAKLKSCIFSPRNFGFR